MEYLSLAEALVENYNTESGAIREEQIGTAMYSAWMDIIVPLFKCCKKLNSNIDVFTYPDIKSQPECRELYDYVSSNARMIGDINGYPLRNRYESDLDILLIAYAHISPADDEAFVLRSRKKNCTLFRFRYERFLARQIIEQQLKEQRMLEDEYNDLRKIRRLKSKRNRLKVRREQRNEQANALPSVISIPFTSFLVRCNMMKCSSNHEIESVRAIVEIMSPSGLICEEEIVAGYCKNCEVYFILENDFCLLRKKGVILCQVISYKAYASTNNTDFANIALKPESLLHQCGYNVNSTDELSELQRHEILKRVLENKLYSKIALMSFLDWLIARSEKVTKKNMTASIQKWRSDRAYVASYELSNSRSVKVGKIRYNQ